MPVPITADGLSRAAYAAYGRSVGFKNYAGGPMPEYEDLPQQIRTAWEDAAISIHNIVNQANGNNLRIVRPAASC